MRKIKLSEIILSDCKIIGEDIVIDGLNLCNRITRYSSVLSYVESDKYVDTLIGNPNIKAILITPELLSIYRTKLEDSLSYIVTEKPEQTFYKIHNNLYHNTNFYDKLDFESKIGKDCNISKTSVIEKGVIIEDYVTIGHNTVIKKGTIIEKNVQIGSNSTIGSEGFQVIDSSSGRINVIHVGGTIIQENAFIGDNTAICNSLFEGYTIIEKNVKIDNLVHVAHNCVVKSNAVLTAGVILCGSTVIEESAWIGTNSTILNNVIVGKKTLVGIGSVVLKTLPDNVIAYGVPAKYKVR